MPRSWRPYVAGALAGLLAIASTVATTRMLDDTRYLGTSSSFVRAAGMLERIVAPNHVAANEYLDAVGIQVDWQFMLVVGILIGSFIASRIDRSFARESTPPIWRDRFGPGVAKRALGAFLGGILVMFGARLAGGCPSGHGLSGLMQLAISGFLAMMGFFAAGVAVAHLVYRPRRSTGEAHHE